MDKIFPLNSPKSVQNSGNNFNLAQAICNWNEIPSHPGLVMAMTYLSNNPIILMILPDKIYVQEIKLINTQNGNSKTKIQDMVATRHSSSSGNPSEMTTSASTFVLPTHEAANAISNQDENENNCKTNAKSMKTGLPSENNEKTTMIILCDDGSLKIYVADSENIDYWLQPHLQATYAISQLRNSPMWSSTSLVT